MVLLGLELVGIGLLASGGNWDPVVLAIVLVLVIGSNLVEIDHNGNSLSGEGLGILVAMALLGPAQAAVIGLTGGIVWLLRGPRQMPLLGLTQVGAMALAGGIVTQQVGFALGATPDDVSYCLALLAGYTVFSALNIVIQFGANRILDGDPFWPTVRSTVVPVLPSHAAMALLASMIVYGERHLGALALAMMVALFFLYLYLLKELVLSQQRAELLANRTQQLASLQVGVLTAMLRTLSMRDRMTARHSAAVARYARELAAAHGCTKEEQDLVHTAGLLHDIGKFILPDHILLADTKLSDEDWNLIKMHPFQGAKVVREVEGYGPVADIIWAHHERIDGRGYPRGLAAEEIPLFSRMISIADTYDVMTSRDSYRDPVSSAEAVAELRRVSGKQLDAELVETFIAMLESKAVAFRHADDADFEAELAFETRVRDHAAPRPAVPVAA
ncbi:MAG TPA: HD domain-containing phosphohydrolase [Solirubrobacteraceae bacterium]|nr:HD domain-containing phosphohydrolase [Solirubrobacteraceae bacterium]